MTKQATHSTFSRATAVYNQGLYEQALALFEQALKQNQNRDLSLRNKGLCEFKLRRFAPAIQSLNLARPTMQNDPMLLEALGLSHVHLRSFEAAISPLVERLALPGELSSSCLDALVAATKLGNLLDSALAQIDAIQSPHADHVHLLITKARILSENMRPDEATHTLKQAGNMATSLPVLMELGRIEKSHHRFQECEKYWLAALKLAEQQKNFAACEKLLRELLAIHSHAGQPSGIRQLCKNLLKGFPTDENRVQCLIAFVEKSMSQDALDMIAQIQDQQKYAKEILVAKARVARDKQDIPNAIGNTLTLLQQNPQDAFMICNLGLLLSDCGLPELAAAAYTRALEIRPDYHMAKWNLAISHFLRGHYKDAFELAESRWQLEHLMGKRPNEAPELQRGEQIAGKAIFVYFEQGLGDSLQFCRFAQTLAGLGARVCLRVQNPLVPLVKNSFPNIEVLSAKQAVPKVDRQIALLSIPYVLHCDEATLPAPMRYLHPDTSRQEFWKQALQQALPAKKMPKVGLAWSGSSTHKNDKNRSIPLEMMEEILRLPVQFVAVQKDLPPALLAQPRKNLFTPGDQLQDFNDTAQLMEQLDLIISIDSSPAHLAGAIGKPVWLLLPRPCDWRWKAEGNTSVWYQSMRIFRQDTSRQWHGALLELKRELLEHFKLKV
ncbi:MAG TPA: tetratricopeptide repeat protein [Limnobacter sp.]|nr:tetratricopeptide repeat protein [Limnobacter sp.]